MALLKTTGWKPADAEECAYQYLLEGKFSQAIDAAEKAKNVELLIAIFHDYIFVAYSPGNTQVTQALTRLGRWAVGPLAKSILTTPIQGYPEKQLRRLYERRRLECEALKDIRDPGAVQALLEVLHHEPRGFPWKDSDCMVAATHALGEIRNPEVMEPLLAQLRGSNEEMRTAAAVAISKIGDQRTSNELTKAIY